MAEFEGTCDPDKSCSISRDSGLSTAFTIAHEMAHGYISVLIISSTL